MKEEITSEEFADFVRFMRQSTGLSQKKFGDAVGVTSTAIGHWELGKHYPRDMHKVINNIRHVVKERIKKRAV